MIPKIRHALNDFCTRTTTFLREEVWSRILSYKWFISGLIIVTIICVIVFVFVDTGDVAESVLEFIDDLGVWGPVVLGSLLVPWSVLALPCSVLQLGAGYLFDFGVAIGCCTMGTVIGALLAFVVGRYVARSWIQSKIDRSHDLLLAFDEALGDERYGLYIVFLMRLSPVIPANMLNYGLSLSSVSFQHFAMGSSIGMIPGVALMVYLGSLADSLSDLAHGEVESNSTSQIFWIIGLIATIIVTFLLVHLTRRVLKEILENRKIGREAGLDKSARRSLLHENRRRHTYHSSSSQTQSLSFDLQAGRRNTEQPTRDRASQLDLTETTPLLSLTRPNPAPEPSRNRTDSV